MTDAIQTAVVGVTGYAGAELARLLAPSSSSERHAACLCRSRRRRRTQRAAAFPFRRFIPKLIDSKAAASSSCSPFHGILLADLDVEVLFLATPHEQSREWVPEALARGIRVIDLSGAWRLNEAANRAVYGFEDEGIGQRRRHPGRGRLWHAGTASQQRSRDAQLVANPGCYATSIILALKPLVAAGLVDLEHGIVADAKSGVSGAGKAPTAKTHFMYAADNLSAYGVFSHRHTGELLEQIGIWRRHRLFSRRTCCRFRAEFFPLSMCGSANRRPREPWRKSYSQRFSQAARWCGSTRTRCRRFNIRCEPTTADIGFQLAPDGQRAVIVSCLDNLLKGASGQAVQN